MITEDMQEELNMLRHDIGEVARSVNTILALLNGNELDRQGGLVEKIHKCNDRIDAVEKFIDRIKWVGIGMSIPAGVGLLEIFKVLFSIAQ